MKKKTTALTSILCIAMLAGLLAACNDGPGIQPLPTSMPATDSDATPAPAPDDSGGGSGDDPAPAPADTGGGNGAPVDGNALYAVGDPDTNVLGWWEEFSDAYEIPDGGGVTIRFNNYGRNQSNQENYAFVFSNLAYTRGGQPPDAADGYAPYGGMRADMSQLDIGDGFPISEMTFSWGWDDFYIFMQHAEVSLNFSRDGSFVTLDGGVVDLDGGATYSFGGEIAVATEEGAPLFVFLTGEKVYIEVLEVR